MFDILGVRTPIATMVLIALLALVSGCGRPDRTAATPPPPRRVPDPPDYNKAACQFQPDEGGQAHKLNHVQTSIVKEENFGKPYDSADLEAVLGASAMETAFYVLDMGIAVYRIPRQTSNACPTYYVLDPLTQEGLWAKWNEASKGSNEGQLAGLYTDDCAFSANCSEWQVVKPTILISEITDRWTLVHEMMHYNFDVFRRVAGSTASPAKRKADSTLKSNQQLYVEFQALTARIAELKTAYKNQPIKADLNQLAQDVVSLTEIFYAVAVRSEFEEMADEILLLEKFLDGSFKWVSKESAESAAWYIGYARKLGMSRFDEVKITLAFVTDAARQRYFIDILQIADEAREKIASIDKQTAAILARANEKAGVSNEHDGLEFNYLTRQTAEKNFRRHIDSLENTKLMDQLERELSEVNKH